MNCKEKKEITEQHMQELTEYAVKVYHDLASYTLVGSALINKGYECSPENYNKIMKRASVTINTQPK